MKDQNKQNVEQETEIWGRLERYTIALGGVSKHLQGKTTKNEEERRQVASQVSSTGVLIERDGTHAILTAGHTVKGIEMAMGTGLKFGHPIMMPHRNHNQGIWFPKIADAWYKIGPKREIGPKTKIPWPDAGIISLSKEQAQAIRDQSGKTFYGMDAHPKWELDPRETGIVVKSATNAYDEERVYENDRSIAKYGWLMPVEETQTLGRQSEDQHNIMRLTLAERVAFNRPQAPGQAPEERPQPRELGGTSGSGAWLIKIGANGIEDIKLVGIITSHLPRDLTAENKDVLIAHTPWDMLQSSLAIQNTNER